MGKKKIKHLGRRSRKNKIKQFIQIFMVLIIIFVLSLGVRYIKNMFVARSIENSKVEFYMDVADEVGNGEAQLNWKELLSIDMFIYNNDLVIESFTSFIDIPSDSDIS